jgi:hypothetical protein
MFAELISEGIRKAPPDTACINYGYSPHGAGCFQGQSPSGGFCIGQGCIPF